MKHESSEALKSCFVKKDHNQVSLAMPNYYFSPPFLENINTY